MSARKKVVLAVIDALSPEALDEAVADGRAPVLAKLIDRGAYVRDCVSVFPSITPCAASAIATGLGPDEHLIPSMNWYHRGEERYVEYGSSFPATRTFGVFRSLIDTVYNMNLAHLTQEHRTIFEHLDDAGLRTVGTTYLIFRGRHRHVAAKDSPYSRIAEAAQFRHAVWGPKELFYADLYDSRATGCSSTLGLPGQRDRHAGCVAAHCVEHDLFDFLLLSLPDNDTYSHKAGPAAQPASIALADNALERMMHAGGGVDEFLDSHAVIVMSDHSQDLVERDINLAGLLEGFRVLGPADPDPEAAEVAACPGARSAMVYVLDPARRDELAPRLAERLAEADAVDLSAWLDVRGAEPEAVVTRAGGQLRFAPGGEARDPRGAGWRLDGEPALLEIGTGGDELTYGAYPDALGRLWAALNCPRAGDVLLSAVPGAEFTDWGGSHHVGGGSHGSLHECDSHGVLLMAGVESARATAHPNWHIRDVAPLILEHFGLR